MEPRILKPLPGRRLVSDPVVEGTLCAVFSAVGYTAANVCLRAVSDCDPVWVSCVKAFPTVLLVGPWLAVRAARNQALVSSFSTLGGLMVAALVGQLAGNVVFQWSLGVVGIALAVPLTLGAMITSGAVLGRWLLGETVTARMVGAMAVLVVAICVLGLGAPAAAARVASAELVPRAPPSVLLLLTGAAAACLSGLAYSVLGVAIRRAAHEGMPLSTILVTIGLMGTVVLGGWSYYREGVDVAAAQSSGLGMMLLAGVWNAAAFLALVNALRLTGVVHVNALNASQAAMAALAGVLFFSEAPTAAMAIGVALTVVGLLLMKGQRRSEAPGTGKA